MVRAARVAFQGERGAFSEQAARAYFGRSIVTVPLKTFPEVFRAVQSGKSPYGIIPIENSLFGSIHQNYDLLQSFKLKIVGEIKLRVVHALLVNAHVRLGDVRVVYSHPQALGQCAKFLESMDHIEALAMYDTAGAAKLVKESHRTDAGAIASLEAARVYGLKVLRSGIESDHRNFTRFLILARPRGRGTARPSGEVKTSILFSTKNIPGALFKALSVFALRDINLYKIESRPLIGKPWDYLFYLDFKGSADDEACRNALDHLREIATSLKILGSYRLGKTIGDRLR